jgi:cell shape-determining protein MreC
MRSQFSYRSERGVARARRRLFFATALVFVIIAIDMLTGGAVRASARTAAAQISVWGSGAKASITDTGYFTTRSALAREVASLQEQLALYRERAALYSMLARENEQLREMVNIAAGASGITAPVVSSFRASPYGTFLIGAGADDGVGVGDLVLTGSGFVIGRVTDTGDGTSSATALFASGEHIDAIVDGVPVVIAGRGGGNAQAALPRSAIVETGGIVTVPAYGGRPAGVIGRVESDPAEAEQTIYIKLPVDLASTQFVYVVSSSN